MHEYKLNKFYVKIKESTSNIIILTENKNMPDYAVIDFGQALPL